MISWKVFGAWLCAAMVAWIYSFVYRDNVFYKIAEHIFHSYHLNIESKICVDFGESTFYTIAHDVKRLSLTILLNC